MKLEFIKIDQILNNTLFGSYTIYFNNFYISDSSLKIICQNSDWYEIWLFDWTFYFEDTKTNEKNKLIKNKFKRVYFDKWKCCKLYYKVNFEEDQNYELHHSDLKDFIINFFKDTTFKNNFEIDFHNSFNYPHVTIDNSNLIKLLNKSDNDISDILNSNERYSEFAGDVLDRINGIDHIETQTYLNNYTIETSKLGESKFNWYLTSILTARLSYPRYPHFIEKVLIFGVRLNSKWTMNILFTLDGLKMINIWWWTRKKRQLSYLKEIVLIN